MIIGKDHEVKPVTKKWGKGGEDVEEEEVGDGKEGRRRRSGEEVRRGEEEGE